MKLILRFTFCISLFFISFLLVAQNGKLPPFQLQIQAINGTNLPGLHSCSFAQMGDKWLFIGGRTNGLHGLNSNDGFPPEFRNNEVIVMDTSTWKFYAATLNQLPAQTADPMRSTNMQYIQQGDYLYMVGGYGYDSLQEGQVTFPVLTAVHVPKMIDAVINAKPISSAIRQLTDTNMRICGGELIKLGNDYYLLFGHNFNGTYDNKASSVLFSQEYSNRIKKFNLSDNGNVITLSNFTILTDTTNFHRRDLTVCPVVKPDGSFAVGAYGGVFQKQANLPYLEPILLSAPGTTEIKSYKQVMSQYTCAVLPIYDATKKNMYTTFFGGISLNDYDATSGKLKRDTLMPFINDVTTLTQYANGTMEETILPLQLPGLLGCNAKFVLNKAIASYSNDVINLNQLPTTTQLIGYVVGGIKAQAGNFGSSAANNIIYRVYLTPLTSAVNEISSIQQLNLYPNPASQTGNTTLEFTLKQSDQLHIRLTDITGKEIQVIQDIRLAAGVHRIKINTDNLTSGFYLCELEGTGVKVVQRLIIQ
ncbi:MAG TPA: T9SS type A sorting domain-containing protein [Bacteroidia bacterium]|jgi:hypothetical protein|nr:T9SS type A sorting domain-containing protein [Bacteroidia bacterium]